MKELTQILQWYQASHRARRTFALATVVRVEGSSYRRPGARMLVGEEGILFGSVSGGCLEKDVVRRARAAVALGRPAVVRYDSMDDLDDEDGPRFRTGCRGVIDILVEPLTEVGDTELGFLSRCFQQRTCGLLAKITRDDRRAPKGVGSYFLMEASGDAQSFRPDSELDAQALCDAKLALHEKRNLARTYPLTSGEVDVFFEVLSPPPKLLLIGTGPDILPLLHLAKEVGFDTAIVDAKATYPFPGRFIGADHWFSLKPDQFQKLDLDASTSVAVLTHSYPLDVEIVKALRGFPLRYLGLLGSKARTERLLAELEASGHALSDDQRERFHSPIGLDIGAESPDEIALSIVAEVRAALHGRAGGSLRDRKAAIHRREM